MYDPDGDGDGSVKDGMKLSTDVDTLRNCALRETFEETGILPLKPGTAHGAGGERPSVHYLIGPTKNHTAYKKTHK